MELKIYFVPLLWCVIKGIKNLETIKELGGTPSPHDGLVPFLDHETGTVYFFDVLTEELVGGATLANYASKSGNGVARGACAPMYPKVGVKVSTKFAPDACAPASPARSLKDHTQDSPTSVMFVGVSEAEQTPALSCAF